MTRTMGYARLALVLLTSLWLIACGKGAAHRAEARSPQENATLEFSFAGIDGTPISSTSTRGRITVLLFMTTFDVASQAQARRLEDLYRTHVPRLNPVGVIVEAPQYVELARSFRESIGLSFPLAIVERSALLEHPELRRVESVPAWIILDAEGRVRASAAGALSLDQLESLTSNAE